MKRFIKGCLLVMLSFVFLIVSSESHAAGKTVTVKRFSQRIYSIDETEAIPIKNAFAQILYYKDGKQQILVDNLMSDDNGEIKNVTVNVPEGVSRMYFKYVLKNPELGSLVNAKGGAYWPITSIIIPENCQVDQVQTRFIRTGDDSTIEFNYQSIKVWNLYQAMVQEMKSNVQTTLEAFPELKDTFNYTFDPLPVLYEYNYKLSEGAFLGKSNGVGTLKKGDPYSRQ